MQQTNNQVIRDNTPTADKIAERQEQNRLRHERVAIRRQGLSDEILDKLYSSILLSTKVRAILSPEMIVEIDTLVNLFKMNGDADTFIKNSHDILKPLRIGESYGVGAYVGLVVNSIFETQYSIVSQALKDFAEAGRKSFVHLHCASTPNMQ